MRPTFRTAFGCVGLMIMSISATYARSPLPYPAWRAGRVAAFGATTPRRLEGGMEVGEERKQVTAERR